MASSTGSKSGLKQFLVFALVLFFGVGLFYLLTVRNYQKASAVAYAGDQAAFSVWPAPPLAKVLRDAPPPGGNAESLVIEGARNETASAQACVQATADVDAAGVSISGLKQAETGAVIPAGAVSLHWERYIDIDRNTSGLPEDELVAKAPNSIPDPFWEASSIPLKANQTQALWIDLAIPTDAAPGEYEGALTLTAGTQTAQLPVKLHVWGFVLPEERHLSVVNWWRFPGVGFEDKIEAFSDEYYEFLGKCCDFLAAHRQTDIQTSLGQLIQEIEQGHGTLSYDTSRLERYAATAFEHGIRRIHLHGVGTKTGGHVTPEGRIKEVPEAMNRLPALEAVIQKHGWQGRIAVNISDEPFIHHEQSYAAVVDRVHEMAPSVRVIEAVEAEYFGDLDIYVPKLSHLNLWYPRFREVQREGKELWYYTCCHPTGRYPNRFLDQSLVKARALHWLNYLYDLDGYLHWGLNHFHGDDPYTQEAISYKLPLGDRAVVYPGENGFLSSLRFNTMRDGLQDFEYLWVLEDKLRQIKEHVGEDAFWLDPRQRPVELCRRVVQSFYGHTRDAAVLIETRRMIADEIVALDNEPLLVVQTSPPENTFVPAGPRNIGVRGLTNPGAAVTVNGKNVPVRESGYFCLAYFMPDDQPVITVTVEHAGKQRSAARSFILEEE